jgi:hypothetical protein
MLVVARLTARVVGVRDDLLCWMARRDGDGMLRSRLRLWALRQEPCRSPTVDRTWRG